MKQALLLLLLIMSVSAQTKRLVEAPAPKPAVVTVQERKLQSVSLGREMPYRVVLPNSYNASQQRYPVLFLLHGLGGAYTDWETRTHMLETVSTYELIIVLVEGGNSWYVNSATDQQDKYEDYIVKDLLPDVEKNFRTIQTKFGHAIAGLSMGGYGAMKYALKYPATFDFAGSFSGALLITRDQAAQKRYAIFGLVRIFAPIEKAGDSDNDLLILADKADLASMPFLYLDCGVKDPFLPGNREFVKKLQEKKIDYEYRELAGEHNWAYWDQQLDEMLRVMSRRMKVERVSP